MVGESNWSKLLTRSSRLGSMNERERETERGESLPGAWMWGGRRMQGYL